MKRSTRLRDLNELAKTIRDGFAVLVQPRGSNVELGGPLRLRERWREQARYLKREVYALYFAVRNPRVPWYAKALAACVVGYAFSPIDLIPDPIPILGHLDDLLLIPLGVLAVRALIPGAVLADCRARARQLEERPRNWIAAGTIVSVWLLLAAALTYWLLGWISH